MAADISPGPARGVRAPGRVLVAYAASVSWFQAPSGMVTWVSILSQQLLAATEQTVGRGAAAPLTLAWQLFMQAPWLALLPLGWLLWDRDRASAPGCLTAVLGVLESTRRVVDAPARRHRSAPPWTALAGAAGRPGRRRLRSGGCGRTGGTIPTAAADYVLVLDALNFCFWAAPGAALARSVRGADTGRLLGAGSLPASGARRGHTVAGPRLPRGVSMRLPCGHCSRGRPRFRCWPSASPICARWAQGLLAAGGSFANIVRAAGGSGESLVREVVRQFPSFDDVETYDGRAGSPLQARPDSGERLARHLRGEGHRGVLRFGAVDSVRGLQDPAGAPRGRHPGLHG